METQRNYPTHNEVISFELTARRAQAAELSRLFALAVRKLWALATRVAVALRQPSASASVIDEIGAALPPELRARYAGDLAAAARVEPWINFGLAAWDLAARALARVLHDAARGLHASARAFDAAARRFTPVH